MKTITCAQMGGPCEAEIMGATPEEMMSNGMKHLEEAHPEMAADVKATPQDDPKMVAWNEKFIKDWADAPETH
jgi:predicted small metal-binding protein